MAIGNGALALGTSAGASGANSVALGAGSRALDANVVSVGGGNGTDGPATRRIVNVADGRIAAGSSDAITGSQLNVTNQRVGAVETRVGDFDSRIATVETTAASAVGYDDASRDRLTLSGFQGTTIDNVGAGSIAAGSRQAIDLRNLDSLKKIQKQVCLNNFIKLKKIWRCTIHETTIIQLSINK